MGGSSAEGWEDELERWLAPFLARLGRQAQRRWAPFYLKGLLLPGERKSVEPMAARVVPGDIQQLHHFVSTSPWETAPLEDELVKAADRLVGGPDAVLVVDDTALVKQGKHSVGVKRQYCGQLGKKANCQSMVSLTLAGREVPVCVGLRLFLPENWAGDAERRRRAGVPEGVGPRPKWRIALDEIDRVLASGCRFGCVLADAEYGKAAEFRAGLAERRLAFAVGILPTQKVYPADVALTDPARKPTGRPAQAPGAFRPERAGGRAVRGPAGAVPHDLVAGRHQGAAPGRVRRSQGAGGRWAGRGPRPAPTGRGGMARRRAPRCRRAEVLSRQPYRRCLARDLGRLDQGTPSAGCSRPCLRQRIERAALDGSANRCTSSSRTSWGWTISRAAPGAACTTTPSCASSHSPSSNTCGSGGKSAGGPPEPGPPPRPSLPAVRRRILAALTRVLLRCPHCRQTLRASPSALNVAG